MGLTAYAIAKIVAVVLGGVGLGYGVHQINRLQTQHPTEVTYSAGTEFAALVPALSYRDWLLSLGSPEAAVKSINLWVGAFKLFVSSYAIENISNFNSSDFAVDNYTYDEAIKNLFLSDPKRFYFFGTLDMNYAEDEYLTIIGNDWYSTTTALGFKQAPEELKKEADPKTMKISKEKLDVILRNIGKYGGPTALGLYILTPLRDTLEKLTPPQFSLLIIGIIATILIILLGYRYFTTDKPKNKSKSKS